MMNHSKKFLISAAVSGILSAGIVSAVHAASADSEQMGKCYGANSCKGKSDCGGCKSKNGCKGEKGNKCKGAHGCKGGKNSCKGKGFLETTQDNCNELMKTNQKLSKKKQKNIYFEPNDTTSNNTDNSAQDAAAVTNSDSAE